MGNSLQFIACKFRADDHRAYTYHNEGAPVVVGDLVKIEDARSGMTKTVIVTAIVSQPTFATKAILGLADQKNECDEQEDMRLPTFDGLFSAPE